MATDEDLARMRKAQRLFFAILAAADGDAHYAMGWWGKRTQTSLNLVQNVAELKNKPSVQTWIEVESLLKQYAAMWDRRMA